MVLPMAVHNLSMEPLPTVARGSHSPSCYPCDVRAGEEARSCEFQKQMLPQTDAQVVPLEWMRRASSKRMVAYSTLSLALTKQFPSGKKAADVSITKTPNCNRFGTASKFHKIDYATFTSVT